MKRVNGKRGQSMIDVAVQHCGSADYAYEVAKANGLEADAVLEQDTDMEVPMAGTMAEKSVVRAGVEPCTGVMAEEPWDKIGLAMVGELTVR